MTIGIYSLYWEEQDLIYIGQSVNISSRYSVHIKALQKGQHYNFKLQNAYNLYGKPALSILEECDISNLDYLEGTWAREFRATDTTQGLNILEPGSPGGGSGVHAAASRHPKLTILLVFKLLYDTRALSYKEISDATDVPVGTVEGIRNGKVHTWLKQKYPHSYAKMLTIYRYKNCGHIKTDYITNPTRVLSPLGEIIVITDIKKFSEIYMLDSSAVGKVIRGSRASHKGWTLPK